MLEVSIELGPERRAEVAQALAAEGFAAAEGAPWARVVEAREGTFEDAGQDVGWVLAGGVLAVCGGTGPLLSALHLTPVGTAVHGEPEALASGLPALPHAEACPVTGVGYALYRVGEACVALAGPRGEGFVLYVVSPGPRMLAAGLSWIRARADRETDNAAS